MWLGTCCWVISILTLWFSWEEKSMKSWKHCLTCSTAGKQNWEKRKKESFEKLSADIELFGRTHMTLEEQTKTKQTKNKPKNKENTTICKYWNRGFCKNKECNYVHNKEDCEEHIRSENCLEKRCHKRHRNTCKYWNQGGCKRGKHCQTF